MALVQSSSTTLAHWRACCWPRLAWRKSSATPLGPRPMASTARFEASTTWPQLKWRMRDAGVAGNSCAASAATGDKVPLARTTACAPDKMDAK